MKYRPTWDMTTIPDAELASEWSRRRSAKRGDKVGGRPAVLRPCPKCGQEFGARELREHIPKCHHSIHIPH